MKTKTKYIVDPNTGCWLWPTKLPKEYGPHKEIYKLLVGFVPDHIFLDHLCFTNNCVNPEHLEPVTPTENSLRMVRRKRTHCAYGHDYSELGAKMKIDGRMKCKKCWLESRTRNIVYGRYDGA